MATEPRTCPHGITVDCEQCWWIRTHEHRFALFAPDDSICIASDCTITRGRAQQEAAQSQTQRGEAQTDDAIEAASLNTSASRSHAALEKLLQAVEEVDGAWWDEGDRIDYRPDLFELLVELRGAHNDYEATALPAQREPATPELIDRVLDILDEEYSDGLPVWTFIEAVRQRLAAYRDATREPAPADGWTWATLAEAIHAGMNTISCMGSFHNCVNRSHHELAARIALASIEAEL